MTTSVIKDAYERGFNRAYRLMQISTLRILTLDEVKLAVEQRDALLIHERDWPDDIRWEISIKREGIGAFETRGVGQMFSFDDYGKQFICWTSRPTEEERKKWVWGN